MSQSLFLTFIAAIATFATASLTFSSANAGETIRIETRPFYGAVITREAGVRVFRPLPPTSKMIINPNRTPLTLNVEDGHHGHVSHSQRPHTYGHIIRIAPARE